MIKKYILSILFSVIFNGLAFSQIELGGTCGFGITNNYLSIDVAPELSYSFTEHMKVGASPFWLYNNNLGSTYWNMMYGGRLFAEYHFTCNILIHAEYELARITDSEGFSKVVSSLPIGIGGTTALTTRSEAYALILYDVLYDEKWAIRTNPMFRAGVRYRF